MDWALASQREDERTSVLGMVIALASFAMLFAALFLAYLILRVQNPIWPPIGSPPLPVGLAAVNTVVLLASSAALVWGSRWHHRGELRRFTRATGVGLLLGIAFLVLQVRLWQVAHQSGLSLSGIFGSVVYTLTWAHAAHMVGGVAALAWLFWGATRGRFPVSRRNAVVMVSMFWHFLDLVWVCLFVGVFVL